MDETALNYSIQDISDDGSSIAIINDCTYENNINYANEDITD